MPDSHQLDPMDEVGVWGFQTLLYKGRIFPKSLSDLFLELTYVTYSRIVVRHRQGRRSRKAEKLTSPDMDEKCGGGPSAFPQAFSSHSIPYLLSRMLSSRSAVAKSTNLIASTPTFPGQLAIQAPQ